MVPILYQFQFDYLLGSDGESFPGLVMKVRNPNDPDQCVEVQAALDTGAGGSLFQGFIPKAIGLELPDGERTTFQATNGSQIDARIHQVVLCHPDLGSFLMDIAFGTGDIRRNLLGRDFFNLAQIAFRERHSLIYITPNP